jgi:phosphonopyruvate decarboxylase
MSREHAISVVTGVLPAGSTIVSTTGMISRELYEQRVMQDQDRSSDFLTVGSMGHASQIALGIARSKPEANVVCLDGDGAALMHLGGFATIGATEVGNLLHIVLNNGVHDSVGGQPTVSQQISLTAIAKACGYSEVADVVTTEEELRQSVARLATLPGRRFVEVLVTPGSRSDLGRPKETPIANRDIFVAALRA